MRRNSQKKNPLISKKNTFIVFLKKFLKKKTDELSEGNLSLDSYMIFGKSFMRIY